MSLSLCLALLLFLPVGGECAELTFVDRIDAIDGDEEECGDTADEVGAVVEDDVKGTADELPVEEEEGGTEVEGDVEASSGPRPTPRRPFSLRPHTKMLERSKRVSRVRYSLWSLSVWKLFVICSSSLYSRIWLYFLFGLCSLLSSIGINWLCALLSLSLSLVTLFSLIPILRSHRDRVQLSRCNHLNVFVLYSKRINELRRCLIDRVTETKLPAIVLSPCKITRVRDEEIETSFSFFLCLCVLSFYV